ncbi:hypothetical protein [Amaricoccus sp.]|uniref:hypothetical protein n=1 Tax=Amaricoccus sp. TaxID=1872485 RepID=UPI001B56A950|nr:hypothetical protein [Amaricoccus sp.]MBP7241005.1 hypothetical protein [Amaricoccus sp.]
MRHVILGLAATLAAAAAAAQGYTQTLRQVEIAHPGMSPIHIEKCDKDGDGLFTRAEIACVDGIYRVMYLDN